MKLNLASSGTFHKTAALALISGCIALAGCSKKEGAKSATESAAPAAQAAVATPAPEPTVRILPVTFYYLAAPGTSREDVTAQTASIAQSIAEQSMREAMNADPADGGTSYSTAQTPEDVDLAGSKAVVALGGDYSSDKAAVALGGDLASDKADVAAHQVGTEENKVEVKFAVDAGETAVVPGVFGTNGSGMKSAEGTKLYGPTQTADGRALHGTVQTADGSVMHGPTQTADGRALHGTVQTAEGTSLYFIDGGLEAFRTADGGTQAMGPVLPRYDVVYNGDLYQVTVATPVVAAANGDVDDKSAIKEWLNTEGGAVITTSSELPSSAMAVDPNQPDQVKPQMKITFESAMAAIKEALAVKPTVVFVGPKNIPVSVAQIETAKAARVVPSEELVLTNKGMTRKPNLSQENFSLKEWFRSLFSTGKQTLSVAIQSNGKTIVAGESAAAKGAPVYRKYSATTPR